MHVRCNQLYNSYFFNQKLFGKKLVYIVHVTWYIMLEKGRFET